ncbi:hypothetical protein BH11PLA2_BH11PLA2_45440 [soil metagenome]
MSLRKHSIGSIVAKFLKTLVVKPVRRMQLDMTPLEDRIVPAIMDLNGLRFSIPGNFNSTPITGGTKFDTTEILEVGLIPTAGSTFKPLLNLPGGGIIDDLGAASDFISTANLEGITGASKQAIAGAGAKFVINNILPGQAGEAITTGQSIAVAGQQFKANGLRFNLPGTDSAESTIALAGDLSFAALNNAIAPITGKANEAFVQIGDAKAQAAQFIEAAKSLSFPNPFEIGKLSFAAKGISFGYDTAVNQFSLYGTASFTLKGNPVEISVGDAASPGLVVENGTVNSFHFAVTGEAKVGGLTFTADMLGAAYSSTENKYTITGGAKFAVTVHPVGHSFGVGESVRWAARVAPRNSSVLRPCSRKV